MGNSLLQKDEIEIPFTGWPNDRVLYELNKRMDNIGGVFIIVLDEIDHLVKKAGDDILYNLTNMNSTLKNARSCVIGISNDLKFTDYLDPRVRSRLGQLDVLFKPYSAGQLQDILRNRAKLGLKDGIITSGVIELCSAIAAQEQGDARCALDLLRVSAEMAERGKFRADSTTSRQNRSQPNRGRPDFTDNTIFTSSTKTCSVIHSFE